jgi:hypothetical protein
MIRAMHKLTPNRLLSSKHPYSLRRENNKYIPTNETTNKDTDIPCCNPSSEGRSSSSTGMSGNPTTDQGQYVGEYSLTSIHSNLSDTDLLVSDNSEDHSTGDIRSNEMAIQIRHAPLVGADAILQDTQHLLPQYGLIGMYGEAKIPDLSFS